MKRIITCSDGTWNKPGTKEKGIEVKTNVEKIYGLIPEIGRDNIQQVKIYDPGVGTGYDLNDRVKGGMSGEGIDKNIKDVYTFIVLNYEADEKTHDELYFFGFSRGAYTARSLAGFIRNCGVLKPQYLDLVDRAYELYRDRNVYTAPDSDLMRSFKRNYCYPEKEIKFIGVWDTVGSLGIPFGFLNNPRRYQFHDITLSSFVENAYQALAIDERRKLFLPTLWKKSETALKDPANKQKMEQRWFSGVHSNIGGGYPDTALSDQTLKWIIAKAEETGLSFDETETKKISGNPLGKMRNSFTLQYKFWLPVWREINLNDRYFNQVIDESVWTRYDSDSSYRPKNLPNR